MRARQGGAAEPAVEREALRRHRLDRGRALHVAQLADVELVPALTGPGDPSEEGVARGLHEPLAVHHALALVLVLAGARIRGEHRRVRLLELQEQRVVLAVAHQQDHHRLGPDRADADDLAREVLVVVVVEHDAPIGISERA